MSRINSCLGAAILMLAASVTTSGQDSVLPSVSVRYADPLTSESPDFQRHVTPLLGKLGCNGRACHGSFQGRGGFRLSLFGYDFKTDHDELSGRIDPETPTESLALQKPLMQIPHEGGRRLTEGGWEHHLLLKWVKDGAKAPAEEPAKLARLEVTPAEIVFSADGQQQQLTAVAVWSDGVREDVTALCRFQTNDDQVADIDQNGLVDAGSPGDTHVVAFYDSAVIPVPVLRPVSDKVGDKYPSTPAPTQIDQLVLQKLKKLGIVQSDLSTDAEFLRRASLDVTGTLPTPQEIRDFVADTSADKRARKIDELLERPGYVAWWTTRLCDFTGNSNDQLNNVTPVQAEASKQWYQWIFARVAANVAYDDIVEGMVLAVSRDPGESYGDFCVNQSKLYHKGEDGPALYAEREFNPHYWSRRNFRTSEDRVIGFAYTFLGTRIQCAQCHKHPFDQWSQNDFKQFEGFFKSTVTGATAQPAARSEYNKMLSELDGAADLKGNDLRRRFSQLLGEGKVVPFPEVYANAPARTAAANKGKNKKPNEKRVSGNSPSAATLLGGETVDLSEFKDSREPLMAWLRSPDNPMFARAFVNRVWANYFNRGIVSPSDDMNLANPPVNAPLLNYLSKGFIEHNFDMKWLHREILNSRTYQLSWVPNDTNRSDESNFSRSVHRRLPAEVAFDLMVQATKNTKSNAAMVTDMDQRAIRIPAPSRNNNAGDRNSASYALTVFGRSLRETNCDCDRSEEPSLLQTIFMRNDGQLLTMIDASDGWLAEVAAQNHLPFEANSDAAPGRPNNGPKAQLQARLTTQIQSLKKRIETLSEAGNEKEANRLKNQLKALRERAKGLGDSSENETEADSASAASADSPGKSPATIDYSSIIDGVYLQTVSRFPSAEEKQTSEQFIRDAANPVDGIRGVLWALMNTREFIVNH